MSTKLLLFLSTLVLLISCSPSYKPKNETEKVILAYIKDSLAVEGKVVELVVFRTDTIKQSVQLYKDTLNRYFPGVDDHIRMFDSLLTRQAKLDAWGDSILALDMDKVSLEERRLAMDALNESRDLYLITIGRSTLVDNYRKFVATGLDSLTTVYVDCDLFLENKRLINGGFVLSGDGKKVVSFVDEGALLEKEKHEMDLKEIKSKYR